MTFNTIDVLLLETDSTKKSEPAKKRIKIKNGGNSAAICFD